MSSQANGCRKYAAKLLLRQGIIQTKFHPVSVKEIKVALDRMSAPERAQVQGHLRILRWKESPQLAERLTHAHAEMDTGRKITSEAVEAHLQQLRDTKK